MHTQFPNSPVSPVYSSDGSAIQELPAAQVKSAAKDAPISSAAKLLTRVRNFVASLASTTSAFGNAAWRGLRASVPLIAGSLFSLATCCIPTSLFSEVDVGATMLETAKKQWKKSESSIPRELSTQPV